MDSKTRHELEQNELARWFAHQYEDWIQPNKHWLGYVVLGLLVIIALISITAWLNTKNRSAEWKDFYAAFNAEDVNAALELVANSTSSIVGSHARLALAQRQLAEGSAKALVEKSETIGLLDKAISSFQQVQKATKDLTLVQQAGFGLGQCWETLAAVRVGDDLAKAEEEYRKITERWADSFMGERARQQLALIRQPSTKMFLERMVAKVPEMPTGMADFPAVNIDPSDLLSPEGFDLDRFERGTSPEVLIPNAEPEKKDNENRESENRESNGNPTDNETE